MKRQCIYKWEKHNVLQFVQQNYVLNHYDSKLGYVNGEFTVNTIFKDVPNNDGLYGWGFSKVERYLS